SHLVLLRKETTQLRVKFLKEITGQPNDQSGHHTAEQYREAKEHINHSIVEHNPVVVILPVSFRHPSGTVPNHQTVPESLAQQSKSGFDKTEVSTNGQAS